MKAIEYLEKHRDGHNEAIRHYKALVKEQAYQADDLATKDDVKGIERCAKNILIYTEAIKANEESIENINQELKEIGKGL